MKIMHIITTLEAGGAEKQLVSLVRNQILSKESVHVLYLKGNGELSELLKRMGCHVYSIRQSFLGLIDVRRIIKRLSIDIIHAHLPRSEITAFLTHGPIPFIISRHNSEPFWPRRNPALSGFISRRITSKASAVISISGGVQAFLEDNHEISKKTIQEVVHYGFNSNDGRFPARTKPKVLSLKFLCISRLVEQKDIPTLLKAFRLHLQVSPESTLTIVGTGHLKTYLHELTRAFNISESISWIDHSLDIENIYKNHDCLVLTSLYEGFGLVLLEAMQFGLAIIASSHAVTHEVLSIAHPGLFPVSDYLQLAKLMNEIMNSEKYSANANFSQNRLKYFSPEENCRKIKEIYLACLNK